MVRLVAVVAAVEEDSPCRVVAVVVAAVVGMAVDVVAVADFVGIVAASVEEAGEWS